MSEINEDRPEPCLTKVSIRPIDGPNEQTEVPRRDFFKLFGDELLNNVFPQARELATAYIEGKAKKPGCDNEKTAQEAAKLNAERKVENQMATTEFMKALQELEKLKTPEAKTIALAKIMKEAPAVIELLEEAIDLMNKLKLLNGVTAGKIDTSQIVLE